MVNIRYSRSKKQAIKENKKSLNKIRKLFKKEAKENNINLNKINSIIIGRETFYNPYKHKTYNRWVSLFK